MAADIRRIIKKIYPPRNPSAKKGDFGRALVVGGSKKFTGAPALSALAALRSGADIAVVAAPGRAADIIASFSPDLITVPLEGDFISEKHLHEIEGLIQGAGALAIGPGLSREKETQEFVKKIIPEIKIPCVVDADALYAIKDSKLSKNFVLTPHRGEFKMLSGDEAGRQSVLKLAKNLGATILAKGPIDFVSDGKRAYENRTGTPYMTVGGTGDVLTGVCAAILARGIPPFEAACAAAYINGLAGERAAKKFGEGLVATDLLLELPKTIKDICNNRRQQ